MSLTKMFAFFNILGSPKKKSGTKSGGSSRLSMPSIHTADQTEKVCTHLHDFTCSDRMQFL